MNPIRRVARKAYQKKPSLKLIVIDDVDQLVQASTLSPAEIIAQIKALAKKIGIAHYADVSIILYRDERYANNFEIGDIAELLVLQKHQKDGYIQLKFDGKCACFTEYQE